MIFISHIASIALRLMVCVKVLDCESLLAIYFSLGSLSLAINGDCLICKIFFFNSTVLRNSHYLRTFLNNPKLVSYSFELLEANVEIFFYLPLPAP